MMIRATARIFIWTLLLSLMASILGIAALLYHPTSLKYLADFINATTSIHVHIGSIEGKLASDVTLSDLYIHYREYTLEAEEVHLQWRPENLLIGRLSIKDFQTQNATLTDLSAESSGTNPSLESVSWYLPLQLEIDLVRGDNLHYVTPQQSYDISEFLVEGHFESGVWFIDTFEISSSLASATGTAIVESTSLGITFTIEHFNPFIGIENWIADTNFSGNIFISEQSKHVELSQIKGSWMDKTVQGHFRAKQESNITSWDGFMDINENHFSSEGRISDVPEVSWLIYAPNLGNLLPNAKGHFFSEGILSEDLLMAHFDIDQFRWGRFNISNLSGHLDGEDKNHHFAAEGYINQENIAIAYEGSSFFYETSGTIVSANINDLVLSEPVTIGLTKDTQTVSRSCLKNDSTQLCFDFDNNNTEWSLNIDAQALSLEVLDPFLPPEHLLTGSADMDIALGRINSGQVKGYATITVENGEWEWVDPAGQRYDFPLESLNLSINGVDDLLAHLTVDLSHQNTLDGQLLINTENTTDWREAPIEGVVTLIAADLDAVRFIAPSLELLSGQVIASFEVGGVLTEPALLETHAVLNNVSIPLTEPNTVILIDEMTLEGLPEDVIHLDGTGTMGDGQFSIGGVIDLTYRQPRASITITGEELLLINTSEYRIIASPNITYRHTKSGPVLSGNIDIDKGVIALDDRASARRLSEDVIIINHQNTEEHPVPAVGALSTHLNINIENPVAFSGFGLTSDFTGSLRIDADPSQDYTKADGRLSLSNGEYKAFGKTFSVQTGDIIYNGGPVRNPVVDIRAERSIIVQSNAPINLSTGESTEDTPQSTVTNKGETQSILVGLALKGPLRQPHITFYSEPNMNDGDIVSYLFIGRPQDQASDAQADVLFQAVTELMPFTGSTPLGEKFGLDELSLTQLSSVEGASDSILDNTALVVGKRISDRLYIRYIRGLSNTIDNVTSDFQVRLFLGRHFTLEGNADSNGYGGDLVYSIDRP